MTTTQATPLQYFQQLMSPNNATDGGYYAIKGFAYQIDKAILELMRSENPNAHINIEKIQDIDADSFVMQVKYKEAATFVPSAIKKPIIQLLEEFQRDNDKTYVLYAHFGDLNEYEDFVEDKKLSIENLDIILGDASSEFTNEIKQSFVNNFILDLSPTFQEQFQEAIIELQKNANLKSEAETIFLYANTVGYLRRLIIDNPPGQAANRHCTKQEVLDFLRAGRRLVFDSAFRTYQGEQKYFKLIKDQYFTWRNIDKIERLVSLELSGEESLADIKNAALRIKNKFYKKSGSLLKTIKSGAPYIYFQNISPEMLASLKTALLNDNIVFIDGHSFLHADFSLDSILQPSTIYNNLSLKIINTEENFLEIAHSNLKNTKSIYQFFISKTIVLPPEIKNIEVQIENLHDINFILN